MRYFIGNWKMFGIPKSINILNKINFFILRTKIGKNIELLSHLHIRLLSLMRDFLRIRKSLLVRKIAIKKISFHQIQLP